MPTNEPPSEEENGESDFWGPEIDRLVDEINPLVMRVIRCMQDSGLLHGDKPEDLLDRTLRFLKALLRSLSPRYLSGLSADAVRAFLALHAVRALSPEPGARTPSPGQKLQSDPVLVQETGYSARVHYRPKFQVGGDLVCVHADANHCVWILLADVMGKSVAAHLTAASLEALWEVAEESLTGEPIDILRWMDREMAEYLPENVFVEIVVSCANAQGVIRIAGAGYVQYLTGSLASGSVNVVKFGGMYLGRGFPELFSIRNERIGSGEEIVFATDGAFDQHGIKGFVRTTLSEQLANFHGSPSIHDALIQIVSQCLGTHEQDDDISVVSLRRLESTPRSIPQ